MTKSDSISVVQNSIFFIFGDEENICELIVVSLRAYDSLRYYSLLPGSKGFFETWAVGIYNEYGGYAIGQAFGTGVPEFVPGRDGKDQLKGLPFPNGTCVAKLLFSNANENDLPALKNSPAWQVHRHTHIEGAEFSCKREVQTSHLLQMDIAVVDPRSPSGWVFGTFAFVGTSPGKTAWDHLIPVGVQWGNDPEAFPGTEDRKAPIVESVINPNVGSFQHLGCMHRLNGPADNSNSSCMTCHGGAYTAPMNELDQLGVNLQPIFGFPTQCMASDELNRDETFNRKFPDRLSKYPEAMPLDFSLQLFVAFGGYKAYAINKAPTACVEPD